MNVFFKRLLNYYSYLADSRDNTTVPFTVPVKFGQTGFTHVPIIIVVARLRIHIVRFNKRVDAHFRSFIAVQRQNKRSVLATEGNGGGKIDSFGLGWNNFTKVFVFVF